MKLMKSIVAILAFTVLSTSSVNAAVATASDVVLSSGGDVQTAINQVDGAVGALGSDILRIDGVNSQQNTVINTNTSDITDLQNGKVDTTTFDVYQNSQISKDTNQDLGIGAVTTKADSNTSRIAALENTPKPTNGINGKDGVTTTVTKVDPTTQAKVDSNSKLLTANTKAITATANQSASVATDLQEAKQFFVQQQASSNAQFKSLKDEVNDNKKEARSGAASAIAIASMPQVEAGQSVMFSAGVGSFKNEQALSVGASFHAGITTVKAGVSDSTGNDFAMGAGVGIGF